MAVSEYHVSRKRADTGAATADHVGVASSTSSSKTCHPGVKRFVLLCIVGTLLFYTTSGVLFTNTTFNYTNQNQTRISVINPTNGSNKDAIAMRFTRRRDTLRNFCQLFNPHNVTNHNKKSTQIPHILNNIFVDDERRFLFCKVPKAGISNWKRIFKFLRGANDSHNIFSMPDHELHELMNYDPRLLNTYNEDEIAYRLQNYVKIIFVRHPLDRLRSAYNNKFQNLLKSNNSKDVIRHFSRFARSIIRKYRPRSTLYQMHFASDVKFEEFLKYVGFLQPQSMEKHWATYESHCSPCTIDYDIIGKHETMSEDANYLLDLWNVSNVRFPSGYRSLRDEFCEYHRATSNLPVGLIEHVYKRYQHDFVMFGYDLQPPFSFNDVSECNKPSEKVVVMPYVTQN